MPVRERPGQNASWDYQFTGLRPNLPEKRAAHIRVNKVRAAVLQVVHGAKLPRAAQEKLT